MRVHLTIGTGVGLFLIVALAAGVALGGVRVKLSDVPKPAVKAVEERFPKAAIRYADRETDGNYEFAMKEGDRIFDVGVAPDGKLLNIKEEIEEDSVPKAVKAALETKYPGAKIVETEKVIVVDGKKELLTYELKIKTGKKTLEVIFDEAGKLIEE